MAFVFQIALETNTIAVSHQIRLVFDVSLPKNDAIFRAPTKKSKKWCLLFEPRSSRFDVQIILNSLAKSRRKFGVRPRKMLFRQFSSKNRMFSSIVWKKLCFKCFGELQPRELQNRNLYVKKYATAQNLIKIRKFGHVFVQNQRFL